MKFLRAFAVALLIPAAGLALAQTAAWKKYFTAYSDPAGPTSIRPQRVIRARDGGAFAVSNTSITRFDATGALLWSTPFYCTVSSGPLLAECSNGFYVAGYVHPGEAPWPLVSPNGKLELFKYDNTGKCVLTKNLGVANYDDSLNTNCLVDANDNLYLANGMKIDPNGNVVANLYASDRMSFDGAGNIIGITSSLLVKQSPTGQLLWTRAPSYAGGTASGPRDYAIGTDNAVYVLFGYGAPNDEGAAVQKIDTNGNLVWTSPGISIDSPGRIAVNTDGTLTLANGYLSQTIAWVTLSGAGAVLSHRQINTPQDWNPDGVGNVYIRYGNRIDKYNSAGAIVATFNLASALGVPSTDLPFITFQQGSIYCTIWTDNNYAPSSFGVGNVSLAGSVNWSSPGSTVRRQLISDVQGCVTPSGNTFLMGSGDINGPQSNTAALAGFDSHGAALFSSVGPNLGIPKHVVAEPDGSFIASGDKGMARFNSSGAMIWSVLNPIGDIGVDAAGNVLGCDSNGAFKRNNAGTLLWQRSQSGYSAVDSSGNLIVFFNGHVTKLNPSGTILYDKTFPSDDNIRGAFLATTDSAGNAYFTSELFTAGTYYGAITKLNANGAEVWSQLFNADVNSWCKDTVVDNVSGKVYTVGYVLKSSFNQIAVGKFDAASGQLEWSREIPIGKESQAIHGVLDKDRHLLVSGFYYSTVTSWDAIALRIDPDGTVEQTKQFDAGLAVSDDVTRIQVNSTIPAIPTISGIGTDSNGFAYLFGTSVGPDQQMEFRVVQYGPPPPDDATLVQSAPSPMAAGAQYAVGITATNVGSNAWTAASGYKLDCLQTNWGVTSVAMAGSDNIVNLGTKTFTTNVTAPTTPGTYPLQWRMDHNGTKFGDPSNLLNIVVLAQTNFAQFVSQSVPTTMVAGQSYAVNLQYKNTGTNTWSVAGTQKLQSAHPVNNITWGMTRMPLTNGPVGPGVTGVFGATIVAPSAPGTYNFQWMPIQDSNSLNFGTLSPNVQVVVSTATDAARFVSRTGATTVYAGSDFYSTNTMMNVGTSTWTTAAGYSMMSVNPNNNTTWGGNRINIPASVPSVGPGASVTMSRLCTAPSVPGNYTMQWQMDKGGVPFGDTTPLLHIIVVAAADNAQLVSSTPVPSSIGPSKTFSATFTMKNLGTNSWNAASYSLASVGSNIFGIGSIASGAVAQNANGTFTGNFTAPATPGTYTFQMRMQHGTVKFGQATPSITVVVSNDAAQFVSRSGATGVFAGSDFYATYSMKNTGTTTWTAAAGYSLSISPSTDATWTAKRINVPGSVAPGSSFTNAALCTAPIVPGTYTMQWQMVKSGVPFGEKTPVTIINVYQGADDARFVTQSGVPTNIVHGHTFTAIIIMGNIGTANWDSLYTLASVGSNNFGQASVPITLTDQNRNSSFQASFTAPATPGTYTFQFRMQHGSTKFGQASKLVTIVVS